MEPNDSGHPARRKPRRDPRAASVEVPELPEIPFDVFCQECGYNLRGLTGDRCPECGTSLEALRSPTSQIPWVHRDELGWWRAYWGTVRMVTFHRKRLCEEMLRPIRFDDAQRFRWVTVMLVYVPLLIASLVLWIVDSCTAPNGVFGSEFTHDVITSGWPVVFLNVCLLLFLAGVTGMPSYFFHPRELPLRQQNRAVALSYYAGGPLGWAPIPLMLLVCAPVVALINPVIVAGMCTLAVFLLGVLTHWWWANLMFLARRTMPQMPRRTAWVAVGFPVLFGALWLLAVFVLPVIGLYVVIVVRSLG